jgi:hypothetical protein
MLIAKRFGASAGTRSSQLSSKSPARHREQQQGGEPQRQRHRLHHGCGKAPAQVDQAVAPAVASPGRAQAAESRQQPARHQGEEGQRDQEAAEHDQAEAQFPRHP